MSKNNEYRQFLPDDELDDKRTVVEIPAESKFPYQPDRIPSGYDPMSEIHLRGRASRGLAEGRIPWWVIISGWVILGGYALMILSAAFMSASVVVLLFLAIAVIPLLILWRGTAAKISIEQRRRRKR
jgi:hypothetical protein